VGLETINLTPCVGTEIRSDARTLLSGAVSGEVRAVLEKRGVVIFRDVNFSDIDMVAFAKSLGNVRMGRGGEDSDNAVLKVTLDKKESPLLAEYFWGSFYWHMDDTYADVPPLATLLTPRALSTTGGETEFANTYAAYDHLPEEKKKSIEDLRVIHKMESAHRIYNKTPTREQVAYWRTFESKTHPLVWRHRTGRRSLVLSTSATQVVGMDVADSRALLQELTAWTSQSRFVYQHHWKMGDLLIWDNTGTMHRALPYAADSGRKLHRVTLDGEEPLAA
jgi:alpha-ketoglutarate-dependent taurine dioxygenase